MNKWKAIMFDLDNTLFSHEDAFKKAISECFHKYQQKYVEKQSRIAVDTFFPVFKNYSDLFWGKFESGEIKAKEYRRQRFIATMKDLDLPYSNDIADGFHNHYYEVVDEYSIPFDGVHSFLEWISYSQLKTAIITNGTKDTQYNKIKTMGIDKWISPNQIYVSEEIGYTKPDQKLFHLVEKEQGLKSEEILFIGDSWKHDVVGAIEAGWEAVFLNTRNEERTTDHQPIAEYKKFTDMENDLTELIKEGRST
ncbi:HAD family hydrolase [Salipaludibacillus sp. HK11]|uniref:HAD family hydrolase n=1 Tax=Salipaludibacillus sp. HK11 TaxID=3394320 RepID=UPI0039FC6D3A